MAPSPPSWHPSPHMRSSFSGHPSPPAGTQPISAVDAAPFRIFFHEPTVEPPTSGCAPPPRAPLTHPRHAPPFPARPTPVGTTLLLWPPSATHLHHGFRLLSPTPQAPPLPHPPKTRTPLLTPATPLSAGAPISPSRSATTTTTTHAAAPKSISPSTAAMKLSKRKSKRRNPLAAPPLPLRRRQISHPQLADRCLWLGLAGSDRVRLHRGRRRSLKGGRDSRRRASGSRQGRGDEEGEGSEAEERAGGGDCIVPDVIEKEYLKPCLRRTRSCDSDLQKKHYSAKEDEEFWCSMLGEDSELRLGVIHDVLGECGSNVKKLPRKDSYVVQERNCRSHI